MNLRTSTLLFFILFNQGANGLKPSLGCGKEMPKQPHPGHQHKFSLYYEDKGLGSVYRNYIFQLPSGTMLISEKLFSQPNFHKDVPISQITHTPMINPPL